MTYQYLSTHILSNKELSKVKEIFNNIDTDGNGTLSMEELKTGYCKNMGVWMGESEIEKLFH